MALRGPCCEVGTGTFEFAHCKCGGCLDNRGQDFYIPENYTLTFVVEKAEKLIRIVSIIGRIRGALTEERGT